MNTITLEEGKVYITRGGNKVTIIKTGLKNRSVFNCVGILALSTDKEFELVKEWATTGKYRNENNPTSDIIAEWSPYNEFKVWEVIEVWKDSFPNVRCLRRFKKFDISSNLVVAFIDGDTESSQSQGSYWQHAEKVKC
jgi:hypothetical protein